MSGLIQQGKHPARADKSSHQVGVSVHGTDFVYLSFQITDGPDKGRSIGDYFYLSDAAKQYTEEKLRNAGATFKSGYLDDPDGIGDTECQIVVEHKEHDGKTRASIKYVNKRSGIKMAQQIGEDQRKPFRERNRASTYSAGSIIPAPIRDEDVPF